MRRILLALALILAPAAALAVQDTCTFTGSVSWTAAGAASGSVSCTGGDSTLGGDDIIVISSGTTTIAAGSTITGTSAANAGISVASGATLLALDGATIVLGPAGLTGAVGSTVTAKGKVRSYGAATSTLLDDPVATPGQYFVAGDMLPCYTAGAIDCATNPNIMGFAYATARWNASSGTAYDRFVDNSLSGIATTDWVCFWDPDPTDKSAGADVNNCYPVTSVSTQHLAINVQQGTVAQSGYPLARRNIKTWTTPNAETRGARTFTGVAGTLTRSTELRGRWLRFKPAANTYADSRAYKISDTTDGGAGADVFRLGDRRGVQRDVASGETAFIDYGWEVGDPFLVMRPVTFTSATTGSADGDSAINLLGTASIAYTVFKDVTSVRVGSISSATAPTLSRFEWVVGVDQRLASGVDGMSVALLRLPAGTPTIKHVSLAGGSEVAGADKSYGLMVDGTGTTVEDVSVRHTSDDMVLVDQTGTGSLGCPNCTFRRIHAAFKGDNSESGSGFETSGIPGPTTLEDFVCDDCATTDNAPSIASGDGTATPGTFLGATMQKLLIWGSACGTSNFLPSTVGTTLASDLTIIGNAYDAGGTGTACNGMLLPAYVDGFAVRDVALNAAGAGSSQLFKENARSIKNGFFLNVSSLNGSNTVMSTIPNNGVIENVAWVNLSQPNIATVTGINLYQNGTYSGGTQMLKNLLFMQTPEFAPVAAKIKSFYRMETTISPTITLDGVAFVGLRSVGALRAFETPRSDATLAHGLCFFDNVLNHNGTLPTPTGTASIQMDQPIGIVDEQAYKVSDAAGGLGKSAICGVLSGAQSPGVKRSSWGHWISKIENETLDAAAGGSSGGWLPRAF